MSAKPLLENIKYCSRCCMPDTQEGSAYDELGQCLACQSSEQKMHIDWTIREKDLRKLLEAAKAKSGSNYDCIVPISGGKDSTFQMHVITKVYGLKALAVTFSLNWYTETGWYNLQNLLEKFNVDHIMYTPNRDLVNRLTKKSLAAIGDVSWHDHAGLGSFPLHIAVKFKIPLLIWGESIAEASGRASYHDPVHKFDRDYFTKVSAKLRADEMVDDDISAKDLHIFNLPSVEEIETVGVHGIHLGDYLFWDEERQTEFIKAEYGWQETEVESAYKGYKSVDDVMSGMHDFTCYLKRGYGRVTMQACVDIRNGLLTREEGFALIEKYERERPDALDYYLQITGMSEAEFYATMAKHRLPSIKDHELLVLPKVRQTKERLLPFPLQLIEKHQEQNN